MQKEIEELNNELLNNSFYHIENGVKNNQLFICRDISKINDKILVKTNIKNFLIYPKDVNQFLENCTISEKNIPIEEEIEEKSNEVLISKSEVKMMHFPTPNCESVSNGLMEMFNKITKKNASEEDYKQAKMVSEVASKIIDIEKLRLGYYHLNMK